MSRNVGDIETLFLSNKRRHGHRAAGLYRYILQGLKAGLLQNRETVCNVLVTNYLYSYLLSVCLTVTMPRQEIVRAVTVHASPHNTWYYSATYIK